MPNNNTESSPLLSRDNILRFIGFVADIIAIVTVLTAIKLPNIASLFSELLSVGTAFIIWILAVYTYICILHDYWKKTTPVHNWSSGFGAFIAYDLIGNFSKPWILFPLLLLLTALYGIVLTAGGYGGAIGLTFGLLILAAFLVDLLNRSYRLGKEEKAKRKFVKGAAVADEKWVTFKPIIMTKLETKQWVDYYDFKELVLIEDIDYPVVNYMLAKVAAEHPEKIFYGNVYRCAKDNRGQGKLIAAGALVNLEHLDKEQYYCG